MIITEDDIDKAITDATNLFNNSNFFRFTDSKLEELIRSEKEDLNTQRTSRYAAPINFIVNADTLLSNRLRAIIDGEGREIKFIFNSGAFGINNSVEIDASGLEGKNGLSTADVSLFKRVVKN